MSIGTDIIQISRVEQVLSRQGQRFVKRILTKVEQGEFSESKLGYRLLAKRFAVKEAVSKALGTGIGQQVSWQDIQVEHNELGAPSARLTGGAARVAAELGADGVEISIADEAEYVVAFAMLKFRCDSN
jgi:holo-[acyl-carrier protein] synthase